MVGGRVSDSQRGACPWWHCQQRCSCLPHLLGPARAFPRRCVAAGWKEAPTPASWKRNRREKHQGLFES